jgi:D-alanyl-D-alanine carboxypeptidase
MWVFFRKGAAGTVRMRSCMMGGILFFGAQCFASPDPDSFISARAAFLMNAETGEVLYQKNQDLPLPPASTTKVMTSILALESGRLEETILVPKEATLVQPSKINLRVGETVLLRDLIYSLLLTSANDASIAVAVALGGSVEKFAESMTARAAAMGAHNTRFKNPHGLTEEGHYSTARDLALIFQHTMDSPLFRAIAQKRDWSIPASGKRIRSIPLKSHNRLLWEFDGVALGKTGYTLAAQHCYVGSVSRDGTELIVSVLGSKKLWADTKKLVELGFGEDQDLFGKKPLVPRAKLTGTQSVNPIRRHSLAGTTREIARRKYSIQLASFQDRDRAVNLREEISLKGYRAVVDEMPLGEGLKRYRVTVGSYSTVARAKSAQHRFKKIVGRRGIVVRSW